jgi:hypothetical protein
MNALPTCESGPLANTKYGRFVTYFFSIFEKEVNEDKDENERGS